MARRRNKQDRLAHLSNTHLECRDRSYGHRWEPVSSNPMRFELVGDETIGKRRWRLLKREIACLRCTTVKVERYRMDSSGFVKIGNTYKYPEGYIVPGGADASAIHMEQFRRSA